MSASYCTVGEITTLGINPDALRDVEPAQKLAAIAATSDKMDGYFSAQAKLPLLEFASDVRECCAVLTGAQLLRTRGYNPEGDPSVAENIAEKLRWLEQVARGVVRPRWIDSSPSAEVGQPSAGPRIASAPSRGFSRLTPIVSGSTFPRCGSGGSFGS